MTEIILQLIAIFDIEIDFLRRRKIKELEPWQKLELSLIDKLSKEKTDIPNSVHQTWKQKIREKQDLIERQIIISRRFFEMLVGKDHLYKPDGQTNKNSSAVIMDKQI